MIRILCVGRIKEKFYLDAISEYMKRMNKYHKIVVDEVMDSDIKREEELLMRKLSSRDYVVTLEIEGVMMDSIEFSQFIDKTFLGHSNIVFVIGGSDGLGERVKKRSDFSISFSKLTFPHPLFRVILLEQIYRSFRILHHESYHK